MRRERLLKLALIVVVALVILGSAALWALPEIIRRVALDQIPKRTGRAVAIEDIDLNLFTGRLAMKNIRLDEPRSAEAFVTAERLDVRIVATALLRSDIRVAELGLVAPSIRVVRTGANEFNFSDLLRRPDDAPPPAKPAASRWTVTLDRLRISRGAVLARDQVVSPPAEWSIQDLGVDVGSLTTRAGAAPGRASVRAKIDEAALDVTVEPLRLDPLKAIVKVALEGFEIRRLNPYVWAATPYRPTGGRLALALGAEVDHEGEQLTKAVVTGTANLDRQAAVAPAGKDDPFLGVSRLAVEVKEADAIARRLTVASVAIDNLDLKARRDAKGVIDLVEIFLTRAPKAAGPSAAPSAAAPAVASASPPTERKLFPVVKALARGFEQILVERITLGPSTATFVDEAVKPTTKLALTKLQATVTDLAWPPRAPAKLVFSTALPGGGTLDINGPVVPQPLDADLVFKVRNAPVTPYQAYIPVPAQLSGRFNGDSRNRIALQKDGRMLLASKGNSWAQDVAIRAPGAERPTIRVERMELVGIDFDWPRRAGVAKAGFRRPNVEVVREADGSFDVRDLFTAAGTSDGRPAASPSAKPKPALPARQAQPKGLLETMKLDFKQVRVEEGTVRFLDRTTTPAFSQDLSKLDVTVTNVNNRPGERAQVAVQSVVGGDSTLDVRGEVSSIGSPAFIDLVGELRRFQLPSVDPYAEEAIGWIIKKGELEYKVRFKLDGDELDTTNEVVVGKLQVAPAAGTDEVKHRIGLPLGMIVALIKDGKGEIRANVPVTGSLKDPKFDLRETIWTAVKNVLINIVRAPFRAIGGLFSGGEDKVEEPKVAPVTFAAGSSVIAPDMEQHLLRVADFLRRAPFVNLELAPMASAADAEALKAEAVNNRLREFQKERGLKDAATVIVAYFAAHLSDVKLPPTTEEQLALLRERAPAPKGALDDLARRRVEATRERLVSVEGIPEERLALAEAKESAMPREEASPKASALPKEGVATAPASAEGAGRVEFVVVAGGE